MQQQAYQEIEKNVYLERNDSEKAIYLRRGPSFSRSVRIAVLYEGSKRFETLPPFALMYCRTCWRNWRV